MSVDTDVFISYRHREPTMSWVRDELQPALRRAGFSTILDEHDFRPGDVVLERIEGSAARARVTVAVVDEHYEQSWYTRYEAALSEALLVIERAEGIELPTSVRTIPRADSDDLDTIIAAIHDLVHRALVLESEADRAFVSGFLLPALRQAKIDAVDVGDIHRIVGTDALPGEALDRAIEWADRVIVVVSRTYLQDLGRDEGRHLQHWEHTRQQRKALPLILDEPDADFTVPPQYDQRLWVDMSEESLWLESLHRICEVFGVETPDPDRAPECPYPGMVPYQYVPPDPSRPLEEFPFFGREPEIDEVLDRLRKRSPTDGGHDRLAAVIGPSGSGKSSLVLAGVLPRVHAGALDGRRLPEIAVIRPTDPGDDVDEAVARLRAAAEEGRLRLLVVDQLEQAFLRGDAPGQPGDGPVGVDPTDAATTHAATTHAATDRAAIEQGATAASMGSGGPGFVERVVALRAEDPELYVVTTMRADFQQELMLSPLWPHAKRRLVYVTPLDGPNLEVAITGPAARRGVEIDPALVVRLANEMRGQPGLLPFLQESLRRLWGRRPWWYLSLSAEQWESGEFGVRKAIRTQATDVYGEVGDRWGEDGRRIVRAVLIRLVHFGTDGRTTRRQLTVDELARVWPHDRATFDAVLDLLGRGRIITLDARVTGTGDDEVHTTIADLSHDALISGWPQLGTWIEQQRELDSARRSWLERVGGAPLTGVDLQNAERWLDRATTADLAIEDELVEYIAASRRLADEARAAEERSRARERRMLRIVSALAVVLLVAVGLTAWQWRSAQSARERAESEADRRVSTQLQTSAASYEGGLALQSLLVRAADVIDETELGAVEMLATVEQDPGIVARIDATTRNVGFEAVAVLPDGRLAIGDGVGNLSVRDVDGAEPIVTTDVGQGVLAIAADPDSTLLAVAGGSSMSEADPEPSTGRVDLVDTADPTLTRRPISVGAGQPVAAALFDGDELIVGSWDGTVTIVDVADPASPAITATLTVPALPPGTECAIDDGDRKVRSIAVDDSGRWLVAGTNHCLVVVWDRQLLGEPTTLTGHGSKVRAVAFVPGTSEVVTTGDDATIRSWDLSDDSPTATVLVDADDGSGSSPLALQGRVITLCVAPDGASVVTAGRDHVVRRWVREDGRLTDVTELSAHVSTVRGVVCTSPDTFVSVAGNAVVVWDVRRPNRWGDVIATDPSDDLPIVAAVRPDGSGEVALAVDGHLDVVASDGAGRRTEPPERADRFAGLAWSADGGALAAIARGASGWPDELVVYDPDGLEITDRHESDGLGRFWSVAAGDDVVVAGMNVGELLVVADGAARTVRMPTGRAVTAVAVLDGGRIVAGDDAGTLMCVDGQVGDEIAAVDLGRQINDLAVSSDGDLAAATSEGRVVVLAAGDDPSGCDPARWTSTSLPVIHDAVSSIDVTASGELLVTATSSGWAELWDVPKVRLVGALALPEDEDVASVSVDPAAASLVLAGDRSAIRFVVDRDGLRARLCELAGRDLTPDEESSFLPDDRYHEAARCVGASAD